MIHCHNLIHEDHDMMGQFEVSPSDADDDPFIAPATLLSQEGPFPP